MEPDPRDYEFDLEQALASVVSVRTLIPEDAFTAGILGTERLGHGVVIRRDGLILTIGYLVTEAETVWLGVTKDRAIPGHVLGYDQQTGFGLVQALERVDLPALELGDSKTIKTGDDIVLAGAGGPSNCVAGRVVAKQEFAGYWEYLLDEALFTAPAHPHWGGAGLIGMDGKLLGIGSLQVQHTSSNNQPVMLNMVVPIDILKPILDDLVTTGRANRPARPWMGLYATEVEDQVVVAGVASKGPAARAALKSGDVILRVAGAEIHTLVEFFRSVWALGDAGVEIPLVIDRGQRILEVSLKSIDRDNLLRRPMMH